jgi:hypothetical protein
MDAHSPTTYRGLPWPVCRYCGLVYLKNLISIWAVKKGCDYKEHPQYLSVLRESVEAGRRT